MNRCGVCDNIVPSTDGGRVYIRHAQLSRKAWSHDGRAQAVSRQMPKTKLFEFDCINLHITLDNP